MFDMERDIDARKRTRVRSLPLQPIQSGPCLTQRETETQGSELQTTAFPKLALTSVINLRKWPMFDTERDIEVNYLKVAT